LKERARDYAPAFFLLLACLLSGLRSAFNWEVFTLVFFCWAVFFKKEGFTLPGGLWPWFFGWLGITSIFSLEPLNSLSQFSKYLFFAFFFSLTSHSAITSGWAPHFGPFGKSGGRAWLCALFGAALVCAFVVLYQRLSGGGVYGIIGYNPNYSAAILTGAFAAAWVFMFSESSLRLKALYGLLAAVFLAGITASNSRGALFAATLAAATYLAVNKKWRVLLYLAAAFSLAAVIVPADWLYFLFKTGDSRSYARVWIWGSALKAAFSSPFFGFGPGLFERAFELFKFPYFNGISYYGHSTIHAHSEVLNLAAESGFPAAALFLGAVFYSVKEKSRDAFSAAMKLCALSLLVQGSFDMVFYSGAVSLLFFGSLGFASGGCAKEAAGGESSQARMEPEATGMPGSQSRFMSVIFGIVCVLGFVPRIVFDRDFSLAMRPGTDPAQSQMALRRALFFAPCNKDLLLEFASARLLSSGNYAYAAAFVENAAVFCPKDPRFPYLAAEAFIYGGNAPSAYDRLEKTLALEPEFMAARVALARLLYSDGKLKTAAAQAAIAVTTASQNRRPYSVYDRLLVNFNLEAFESLKKDLWKKTTTGRNIVSGPQAR